MKELIAIQTELKAPKNQFNAFGKYKYRSCEDILEALKPYLTKYNCMMTISDQIKETGSVIYCESIVSLTLPNGIVVTASACAGIEPNRKGMDIAQSFGSSSSYSRKYALSALFLLDDAKDPDATNTHGKEEKPKLELDSITYEKCRAAYLKDKRTLPLIQEKYEIDAATLKALVNEKV